MDMGTGALTFVHTLVQTLFVHQLVRSSTFGKHYVPGRERDDERS